MATKLFKFFTLLKGGNEVTVESLKDFDGKELSAITIMTYIHELRNKYGAEIETIRDGKKAIAYIMKNGDNVKVPELRRNARKMKKKVTPSEKKDNPFNKFPVSKKPKSSGDDTVPPEFDEDDYNSEILDIRRELGLEYSID